MSEPVPSPLQRLALAFYAFFAILFRAEVASAVFRIRAARRAGAPLEVAPERPRPALAELPPEVPPPVPSRPEPVPAEAAPAPSPAAAHAPAAPPAAAPPVPAPAAPAPAAAPAVPDPRPALQLLAVLQREGRLVDFIEEDLTGFPDSAIGAAARTVHAGCKRAIEELFGLEPVLPEREGALVTIERGFDPAEVRLTGNVVGEPPFRGALRHHGWRAREVKLPPPPDGKDAAVLAPAEVEL